MPTSPTEAPAPVTAVAKHACAACGAQAEWNPGRKALICPYCGTEAPGELDEATGDVREIDLVRTLREVADDERGWQAQKRAVRCRSCRAVSVFDPDTLGRSCDFCGSTALVDYEEIKAPLRPQSLLPFQISESDVREKMRAWYAGKWLAPGSFKKRARVDTVRGVYLPYWTFDAHAFCNWEAESGTYYYTTVTVRDSLGKTRNKRVRQIRWRPMRGTIEHRFDDHLVPGSRGVDADLLDGIEPFPTDKLVPYDTGYLAGFLVEHYQVVLVDAAREARAGMDAQLRQLCARDIPGDTHRNLRIDPDYSGRTFKLTLLPVWLLTYVYRKRPWQLLANGHTGRMAGRYPKSAWKIAGLVALALAAAGILTYLAR